jgi:hypothetical protein
MAVTIWVPVALFSDFCNCLGFIFVMINHDDPHSSNFWMGLGALLQFLGVMRYFKYTPKFYVCDTDMTLTHADACLNNRVCHG